LVTSTFSIIAKDGLQLFARSWEPEQKPKAVICLVHGLGEHSGRYNHLADFLTKAGYVTLSFDLRGHGHSGGKRGHADSLDVLLDDITSLLAEASQRFLGKPLFLYGHSLGGLLVLIYAMRRKFPLAGVIATAPGLKTSLTEQRLKVAFANLLAPVFPRLSLPTGLDPTSLSHDPEIIRAYVADPLVHYRVTLRFTRDCLAAIPWAFEHANDLHLPLLIMHGTADRLIFPEGSQEFAHLVQGACTLKLWDGLYHEIHNEPEKQAVFVYLLNWLDKKYEPPTSVQAHPISCLSLPTPNNGSPI